MKRLPLLFCILLIAPLTRAQDMSIFSIPAEDVRPGLYTGTISRFQVQGAEKDFTLPDTAYQKTLKRENRGNGTSIVLETGQPSGLASPPAGQFLEATRFPDYDSKEFAPLIVRFRKSRDPVRDAERFVHGHITRKTLGIPLLPATKILKGRTGDCTEHSVLLAAILRGSGIPARAVTGMILEKFGDGRDLFVYHMWVEAWQGGQWILADATRPGAIRPNRYIALAYHSLKTETPASYLRAIGAARDMRIRALP